ncbi:hypothetical protein GCM10027570_07430 [Streptomonospora sediminis]
MYRNQPHQLTFHKSSYSATRNECVEVAEAPGGAAVRDTQHRAAGHLEFPTTEWSAFLQELKTGGV